MASASTDSVELSPEVELGDLYDVQGPGALLGLDRQE